MRAIMVGAGRGSRLMPLTEETPKCYAEVGGRRILDWAFDALTEAQSRRRCGRSRKLQASEQLHRQSDLRGHYRWR